MSGAFSVDFYVDMMLYRRKRIAYMFSCEVVVVE